LQEKDEDEGRKDLTSCSDCQQRASQPAISSQIRPAGGNDQQQKQYVELAELEIAMQWNAQRKRQRDLLITQVRHRTQHPANRD
jgi:hypothetical protein